MLTGFAGALISQRFAERLMPEEFGGLLGEDTRTAGHIRFARWWHSAGSQLGPASSLRAIWEEAAVPLAAQLGFSVGVETRHPQNWSAGAECEGGRVGLFAAAWDSTLDRAWRDAVRIGLHADAAWMLCTNGRQLRLADSRRTYSRAAIEFELIETARNPATFGVLWALLRRAAFDRRPGEDALIDRLIRASERHGHAVNRSLRCGVIEALQQLLGALHRCRRRDLAHLFDEALTIVYRALFLMFAESRGLVPTWHPVYRASYTIESLRDLAERAGTPRGLWESFQAISRLAYTGCRAGTLIVPPFNGRLFSPARSPVADGCAVDDRTAQRALLALSTSHSASTAKKQPPPARARSRIDYRDLGVEQLGAVYESVLEFEPARTEDGTAAIVLRHGGGLRKATASFYTPQPITDFIVRRALQPLVQGASVDRILGLKVVDPAMGSGAFLVSACRFLASACEHALVRDGSVAEGDVDESLRAALRRKVAQRCLFGVDLNPTAVQLARLSLWLATLAAGKPLTFLDHRLACGNSLIGASPFDLMRQPPKARGRATAVTPLFGDAELEPLLSADIAGRQWLAEAVDDTVEVVREKERRLGELTGTADWKSAADLWCACWLWPDPRNAPEPAVFRSLLDVVLRRGTALPRPLADRLLGEARSIAGTRRFFHWTLEFPEVFFDASGRPLPDGGFDAVLGNPPWDMLRAGSDRAFLRQSGIYRYQSSGHLNLYQAFVERAMSLTRRGGRLGLVLPSGFATDHTAAALRRAMFDRTDVDTITGFDNRRAIFPIHRSVRFLVCTATAGSPTQRIACRFGLEDPGELDSMPDTGDGPVGASHAVSVSPSFLIAITGAACALPELRHPRDVQLLERIAAEFPRLGDADGWNLRFGRELNATDDRHFFHQGRHGLPVLEGKHVEPFRALVGRSSTRIPERAARRLLDPAATYERPRIAYRDVASASNRLSLIAAVLPAGVVTTHTLFCLKSPLSERRQMFLCALMNSYVANYLIRQVITTHLGSATVEALRIPLPLDDGLSDRIVRLARGLAADADADAAAELQALAAAAYRLSDESFTHVVGTFPLVPGAERARALSWFRSRSSA